MLPGVTHRIAHLQEMLLGLWAASSPVPEDAVCRVQQEGAELVQVLEATVEDEPQQREELRWPVAALLRTCADIGDLCPDLSSGLVRVMGDTLAEVGTFAHVEGFHVTVESHPSSTDAQASGPELALEDGPPFMLVVEPPSRSPTAPSSTPCWESNTLDSESDEPGMGAATVEVPCGIPTIGSELERLLVPGGQTDRAEVPEVPVDPPESGGGEPPEDPQPAQDSFSRCIRELTASTDTSEDGDSDAFLGQLASTLRTLTSQQAAPPPFHSQSAAKPASQLTASSHCTPPPAPSGLEEAPDGLSAPLPTCPGCGTGDAPSPETEAEEAVQENVTVADGCLPGVTVPDALPLRSPDSLCPECPPEAPSDMPTTAQVAGETQAPTPEANEKSAPAGAEEGLRAQVVQHENEEAARHEEARDTPPPACGRCCATCEVVAGAWASVGQRPLPAGRAAQRQLVSEALSLEVARRYMALTRELQTALHRAATEANLWHDRTLLATRQLQQERDRHAHVMQQLLQQRAERQAAFQRVRSASKSLGDDGPEENRRDNTLPVL
eukprot:GGOE01020572.1.p1 GENE.GGOE01020572.1~~GGOE01020572.1.p1  ORF type:complete len:554 (+),score=116.75 GGOE01020572.1:137-1798(+)